MEELKIVYLPPGELTPYEHNARKHAEEDLATIRASVKEFGFRDPIAVWGPNNIIVEGHGRQIVAQEMGLETVPVIRLDDMTDEQRRAYALAHNKTAEMSGWDFTELEAELAELEMDFDMSEFGFDDIQGGVSDEGFTDDFSLKDGDREPIQNMTFTFSDEEAEIIKAAISEMKGTQRFKDYKNPMNMNGNGNALFLVVEEWRTRRI